MSKRYERKARYFGSQMVAKRGARLYSENAIEVRLEDDRITFLSVDPETGNVYVAQCQEDKLEMLTREMEYEDPFMVLAVWPGRYRSDVLLIDNLEAAARSIGYVPPPVLKPGDRVRITGHPEGVLDTTAIGHIGYVVDEETSYGNLFVSTEGAPPLLRSEGYDRNETTDTSGRLVEGWYYEPSALELAPETPAEAAKRLVDANPRENRVALVRAIRSATSCGLKEAVDAADAAVADRILAEVGQHHPDVVKAVKARLGRV